MTGKEFFHLAKSLANSPLEDCSEASQLRTSVSRAYYSVFLTLRDSLANSLFRIRYSARSDVHLQVYRDLRNSRVPQAELYAEIVKDLREKRNSSDYLTKPIERSDAEWAVGAAQACLDWMMSPGIAESVVAGVAAYRKKTNQ